MRTFLLSICVITLLLLTSVTVHAIDWTQDAGNAQRTGYTAEEPVEPWTYKWSYNGSDSTGGTGNHTYNAPAEARTIVSNGRLFIPAAAKGVAAYTLSTGALAWSYAPTGVSFNSAPVSDGAGSIYICGSSGSVYKLNEATGALSGTYVTGTSLNKTPLYANGSLFVTADNGVLHKINPATMSVIWTYTAGSTTATLPAYSATRDAIIYATNDLFVHAVNATTGVRKWRVKPTPNNPGDPKFPSISTTFSGTKIGSQFDRGYPVVADRTGIVLLRMQLPADDIYAGPNAGRFGMTNAESRTWLAANPQYKNLFALNLDTGAESFVTAVGFGSTEDLITGRTEGYGVMPTQPVVKDLGTKEVAYIPFRSAQSTPVTDFRWSGHMGEMVLDGSTVAGLAAGDMRFVKMNSYGGYGGNSPTHIVDEQTPLAMAGNSLLFAHWAASTSVKITSRIDSLGLSYGNPIQTSLHPPIMRAIQSISCKDTTTHWTGSCTNLNYVTDGGRYFNGPGFWSYFGVADPPGWAANLSQNSTGGNSGAGTQYSSGLAPRYTYVAGGYIIAEGNGGDIMVLKHSGTVVAPPPTATPVATPTIAPTPTAQPTPTPDVCPADINLDKIIDITDYSILVQNFFKFPITVPRADIYKDGLVDIMDYSVLVKSFFTPCP